MGHLYAIGGEFRFYGDIVFAFGMSNDEDSFFVCGKTLVDVGDSCKTVLVKRNLFCW